jgi:hypothetical protein
VPQFLPRCFVRPYISETRIVACTIYVLGSVTLTM